MHALRGGEAKQSKESPKENRSVGTEGGSDLRSGTE